MIIDLEVLPFLAKLDECIPTKSEDSFWSKKDINILRPDYASFSCLLSESLDHLSDSLN